MSTGRRHKLLLLTTPRSRCLGPYLHPHMHSVCCSRRCSCMCRCTSSPWLRHSQARLSEETRVAAAAPERSHVYFLKLFHFLVLAVDFEMHGDEIFAYFFLTTPINTTFRTLWKRELFIDFSGCCEGVNDQKWLRRITLTLVDETPARLHFNFTINLPSMAARIQIIFNLFFTWLL